MDQKSSEMITSSMFSDNAAVLNAVASLLARHQGSKDHDASLTAPLLVLTNMPGKDSMLANVILGATQNKTDAAKSETSISSESLMPSFEEVHALATANLVASTERDIARQLAEASSPSSQNDSTKHLAKANTSNSQQPIVAKTLAKTRISVTSQHGVKEISTSNTMTSTHHTFAEQIAMASSADQPSAAKVMEKKDKKRDPKEVSKRGTWEYAGEKEEKKNLIQKVNSSHTEQTKRSSESSLPDLIEPKALVCSYEGCNRKFAWHNHLKYHELTHTNNRRFKCTEESCGKTFFTAQSLKVHQRTHTGEKPFKCGHQDCGKTFSTAGNLKNHERIHTGEQPFVCDHLNCNRRFTERSSLRKHKLTHSGDKPFECNICGKKFTQSGSRRQHLIRHHLDDEIRSSFKHEGNEKDGEEEDHAEDEKRMGRNVSSCVGDSSAVNAVSCSPQVLVLNNAYPGLPTSESIVFSHGLSDHIVTVKTQPVDQSMTDSDSLSLSHTLLTSEGLHDGALHGKSDDLVVLSETSMYQHEENHGDIVYTADILDHEEVTHADYVSSHVDYSGEITHHTNFTHDGEMTSTDDYSSHQDIEHAQSYTPHTDNMTVTEYVPVECIQHVTTYNDSKDLPQAYLDSEKDIAHTEFIGAEEVAVVQYPNLPSSSEFATVKSIVTDGEDSSGKSIAVQFHHVEGSLLEVKQEADESASLGESHCHSDLSYITSSASEGDHSVVTSHSTHTMGTGTVDREIHMDPMMECDDEEPEKQHLSVES